MLGLVAAARLSQYPPSAYESPPQQTPKGTGHGGGANKGGGGGGKNGAVAAPGSP